MPSLISEQKLADFLFQEMPNTEDWSELDKQYVEARRQARLMLAAQQMYEALKYPRFGTTSKLLTQLAEVLDYHAERNNATSLITPHAKRAATAIDVALKLAEEGAK